MNHRTPKRKMRFLSDLDAPSLHGLKKHRSEPALTTYTRLTVTGPTSKDDLDALPESDTSSSDGHSYVTVNTDDVPQRGSDSLDLTESTSVSSESLSLSSESGVSVALSGGSDHASGSSTSSYDIPNTANVRDQLHYQAAASGCTMQTGEEGDDLEADLQAAWEAFQQEHGAVDDDDTEYASGEEEGELVEYDIEPMVVDF